MTTTMTTVGRKPAELSPEVRRRVRRLSDRSKVANEALRDYILEQLDAGESPVGFARALGIPKQTFNNRVKVWKEEAGQ